MLIAGCRWSLPAWILQGGNAQKTTSDLPAQEILRSMSVLLFVEQCHLYSRRAPKSRPASRYGYNLRQSKPIFEENARIHGAYVHNPDREVLSPLVVAWIIIPHSECYKPHPSLLTTT